MIATLVNSFAIVIGAVIGVLLKKGIKEEYSKTIMEGIGLAVLVIGILSAIKTENIILVIGSLVIGILIGEFFRLDYKLERLGEKLQKRFGKGDSEFSKGFVMASLVYCIGAMAVLGSLEAGLLKSYDTLYAKSVLDGVSAIIFAATYGIGVAFSAVSVFIYQGVITLLASVVKDVLTEPAIRELSAVGGILIMAIGLNTLGLKKIKTANMLPALFVPIIFYMISGLFL